MSNAIIYIMILLCHIFIISCAGVADCRGLISYKYKGFDIEEKGCAANVRCALDFIEQNDKYHYILIKKYVSAVKYGLFEKRSHPFYSEIMLSGYSSERGCIYTASVIIHELYHIIFQKIRNSGSLTEDQEYFLCSEKITFEKVITMRPDDEERIVFEKQLLFLEKNGSKEDIIYQKLKMK